MISNEYTPISPKTVDQIPLSANEPFKQSDLPYGQTIIDEVFYTSENPDNSKDQPGEVARAKQKSTYIGMSEEEVNKAVPSLIADCLNEMADYERISRQPSEERLKQLKTIASSVTRIIDYSGPGDYYHLNKNDRFKDDPAMFGADRVRSDQAAKLAIVVAGIKAGWSDEELLLFLNEPLLMNDNEKLNSLRDKARQAVIDSKIRLVYSGRDDEIKAINLVLSQKNIFIPKECVDFVGPEGIDNTVDQTKAMKTYLEENLHEGDAFIIPINIQGIRSMRMAKEYKMIPSNTNAYVWTMPTATGSKAEEYRRKEVKGTVFYALNQQASFEAAPHKLI